MMNNYIGMTQGKLTVIDMVKNKLKCVCMCGKTIEVYPYHFKERKTCGQCFQNEYIIDKETNTVTGMTKNGTKFIFDLEDLEIVKHYSWHIDKTSHPYIKTRLKNKKRLYLHRLVVNAKEGEYVDHIDHNIHNNKKSNLRICTASENGKNKKLYKSNSSGVTGVYFKHTKWTVSITIEGKRKYIGSYDYFAEAVLVRYEAELKYFGEFRYKGNDSKILAIINTIKTEELVAC